MRINRFHAGLLGCLVLLGLSTAAFTESRASPGHWMISAATGSGASIRTGSMAEVDSNGNEIPGNKVHPLEAGVDFQAGYFIAGGLELGPAIQLDYSHYSDPESDAYTDYTTYGLGAQVGYFLELGSFGLYCKAVGLVLSTSYTNASGDVIGKGSQDGFELMPEAGLLIFASTGAAAQIGAYLDYQVMESTGTRIRTSSYGVRIGLVVFL